MSRIRAERITNKEGTGAPLFPNGIRVVGLTSLSNVVAGVTTFTSDVSIGGTLTYEDVTNIDSVGLITARSGLKVTAGGIDVTAGGIDVTGGNLTVDTNTLHVDATNNQVLIGRTTANTSYPLSVEADGNAENILVIGRPSDDISEIGFFENDTTTRLGELQYRQDHVNFRHRVGDIRFATGGSTERLRIGSAGQIGLSGANYGTSGQVMTSQGNSAAPQWADAGGGAWEYVSTHTISGSESTVDFNNWNTASYVQYKLVFDNITSNVTFGMRFQNYYDATDGATGTLYTSGGYANGEQWVNVTGSPSGGQAGYGSQAMGYFGNANAGNQWFGENNFIMKTPNWNYMCSYGHTFAETRFSTNSFSVSSSAATNYLTGVRILFYNSANSALYTPASGKFILYRLKRS